MGKALQRILTSASWLHLAAIRPGAWYTLVLPTLSCVPPIQACTKCDVSDYRNVLATTLVIGLALAAGLLFLSWTSSFTTSLSTLLFFAQVGTWVRPINVAEKFYYGSFDVELPTPDDIRQSKLKMLMIRTFDLYSLLHAQVYSLVNSDFLPRRYVVQVWLWQTPMSYLMKYGFLSVTILFRGCAHRTTSFCFSFSFRQLRLR